MKKCKDCNLEKSLEDFYKAKGNKDGRQGVCKSCSKERVRKWYETHPEIKKNKQQAFKERYARDEEFRKQCLEKRRKYARYRGGKYGYRKHMDDKCRRCGFVPEDMCQLTVDHIDRDRKNNDMANLQTLCGNCHYLKTKIEMVSPEKLIILNLIPSTS